MASHRQSTGRARLRRPLLLLAALTAVLGSVAVASGTVTLVATRGSSMQPLLEAGDLAVVVRGGDYGVGDVLAYDSVLLGTRVLHRVTATAPGGLTLRGDSNTVADPETVPDSAVVGRMVLHVPGGGTVAAATRSGWAVPAVALAVLALPAARRRPRVLGRGSPARTRSRPTPTPAVRAVVASSLRSRRPSSELPLPRNPVSLAREPGRATAATLALALLAALLLAGTGALFTLPATAEVTRSVESTRTWELSWSAPAPVGATYPDGTALSPQPVFTDLVRVLDLRLTTDGDRSVLPVDVTVTTGAGWTAPVPVSASEVPGAVRVDLAALRRTLDRVGAETAVPTDAVTLTVTGPAEGADATVGPVRLSLVGGVLRPEGPLSGTATVGVPTAMTVPATLALGPLDVPLEPVRWALALGVLLAAAAAVTAGRGGLRPSEDRVLAAARPLPAGLVRTASDRTVVDLPDARSLVALARSVERPLLRVTEGAQAWFLVDDGAVLYRLHAVRVGPAHREGVPVTLRVVGA